MNQDDHNPSIGGSTGSMQDTEELRKFRDNWKRELTQERPAIGSSSPSSHTSDRIASASRTSNQDVQARSHFGKGASMQPPKEAVENALVAAFSELLLEEEATESTEEREEGEEEKKTLLHLPAELVLHVASFLEIYELEKWASVCRRGYILARDQSLPQYPQLCFDTWPLTGPTEFRLYGYNWRNMFIHRPRIRDDGIYISRNHYLRPGQTEGAYYQPVHEVVYYRYLRFFPDGQVISTMTSELPKQVIQWFRQPAPAAPGATTKTCIQTGTYVAEEGEITVWQQMSFYTLCLRLQLSSTREGRNDRLSMLQYSCHNKSGTSDFSDMSVNKFQFAKLPKQYLLNEQMALQNQIVL